MTNSVHKSLSPSHPPRTISRVGLVRQVAESVSETFRFRGEVLDRYPRAFAGE